MTAPNNTPPLTHPLARLGVIDWLLALSIALLISALPVWLDGPDELDAAKATANNVTDAIHAARVAASHHNGNTP